MKGKRDQMILEGKMRRDEDEAVRTDKPLVDKKMEDTSWTLDPGPRTLNPGPGPSSAGGTFNKFENNLAVQSPKC